MGLTSLPRCCEGKHLIVGKPGLGDAGTQNQALTIWRAAGFLGKFSMRLSTLLFAVLDRFGSGTSRQRARLTDGSLHRPYPIRAGRGEIALTGS